MCFNSDGCNPYGFDHMASAIVCIHHICEETESTRKQNRQNAHKIIYICINTEKQSHLRQPKQLTP